jgi:hypothetical protein
LNTVLLDYSLNTPDFAATKPDTILQSDRVNPEFDQLIFSLHVDMRRLIAISGIKKETIGAGSELLLASISLILAMPTLHSLHRRDACATKTSITP